MAASWECPSLPMLSFPLKESTQTTFLGIKPMINAHYEEDGDSFQEEIKQLDVLRQNALRPPKDYNGVTMLRRYFGQLHLIRERFPPETIGQLPIDFIWKDAFTDSQYVHEGLQIEQASILYNISALHSMLGCRVKRSGEQFYQGCSAEEQGRQGELIAWLQLSLQKLTAIGKIPKSLGDVREAAKKFFDHVNDKLMVVKRQNDQVYHETIPEADTLEQASGADLVKPISFQPSDPKSIGRDIFARLVPMRAYEAASVYSEEKAKLLRSVSSSVQDKDEELEQYLLSLNAAEIDKLHKGPPTMPDNVLQHHRQMQGKSTLVKKLHSDIQELMKLSGEVTDDLTLITERRKEEANNEETFQSRQGQRSPSQIMSSLWKEADNFSKFHAQASKSNGELKSMFDQHYQYLLLLSGPIATLQAAVPKLTPLDTPAENSTDSARWKELMGKIDEMKKQRKALVGQLRDQIQREDITKTLIGHLGSDKEVFIDEQMKPHREIADIIRKNLDAQENILRAVTEANANKVQVRQTVQELTQQQENMFAALVKAGTTFPLLESKIKEGLGFYTRLHGNVGRLRKRVVDVVAARQSERESVERRRTPDRAVSPDPAHLATPPPRPPKKAEFAGNPIAPEQQTLPNQPHYPIPPPSIGGQRSPSPSHTHQPLTPPPQAPACQSMEEQLQELQRQQQMQLQVLQNLGGGGGLDLQSIQNVIPPSQPLPIQSQPGVNQLPQGIPQGGMQPGQSLILGSQPGQQRTMPNTLPQQPVMPIQQLLEMPGQQVQPPNMLNQQPGMPTQQLPEVPNQQLPEAPTQQLMGGVNQMSSPSPPPSSEQGDLLNLLDSGAQSNLLQAPLQPIDPALNQDSIRAIEDLQLLLQPPGGDGLGSAREHSQPRSPPEHVPEGTKKQSNETVDHKQEDVLMPQEPSSNEAIEPISPPVLEQGAPGGSESVPPQSTEVTPQGGEGVSLSESGSRLPDVLQVSAGQVELDKPDLDLATSVNTQLPPPDQTLTSAEGVVQQPVSETTITITAMSRPIPTAVQSPPVSHAPSFSHGMLEKLEPHPHHIDTSPSPTIPPAEGQFHKSPTPDVSQTEPVGFRSVADLVPPSEEGSHPEPLQSETASSPQLVLHTQTSVPEEESGEQTASLDSHPPVPPVENQSLSLQRTTIDDQNSAFRPITAPPTLQEVPGLVTSATTGDNLPPSTSSLPQLPESLPMSSLHSIQSFPSPTPLSLPTPPSVSPLPPELTMPLQEYHTLSNIGTAPFLNNSAHYENLLEKKEEKIEELKQENEKQRAQVADQRIQIESYKQQLLLLQQQVAQVASQQQKYEQEKSASSGQQAVLMQLLQQQQGMFSQQQAQLDNMSKVTETHRKEQQELESSYKQALAVEKEQKNTLQSQLMQQTHEMQRLQQQLQSQAQQYQTVQLQLHQYHTQIQERDKQLVAFREQHKQIIQTLDQKHQQKVSQLVQQLQEYQAEVKKLRTQRQQSGLMTPVQPMPAQQFTIQQQRGMRPTRPASVPGQVAPSVTFPGQVPPNQVQSQHKPPGPVQFNQAMPDVQRPPQPQAVRPPSNQPQSLPGSTGPPQNLPPPLQPTPSQGYARQESQPQQFKGFQQGQGLQPSQQGGTQQGLQQSQQSLQPSQQGGTQQGFQPSQQGGTQQGFQPSQQGGTQQGFQQSQQGLQPSQQGGTQQGFQQPMVPASSTQPQPSGGGLMRQDSQPFQQQASSKDGGLPPTSSFGFVPKQDGGQNWQQPMMGGNRMTHLPGTPQQVLTQPGQGQYGQLPPSFPQGQTPHVPPPGQQQPQGGQLPLQQFQSPGGQFQPQPGGMAPQFSPAPQQPHTFSQQH